MGEYDEIYKLFAKQLGKTVDNLSSSERKTAEAIYSQGLDNKKEDINVGSDFTSTTPPKVGGGLDITGAIGDFSQFKSTMADSFGLTEGGVSIAEDLNKLIELSQDVGNSMGIGRARAGELRATIADTIPEMTKLGISTQEGMEVIKEIPKSLKTNATVANETIVELAATSKFAGVDVGSLVKEFSSVGTQLSSVGDEMADVANYAKSVGVNVKDVTAGVVGNLKQLNLFNFEGGVQGLAKMQAQSAMLGVNMDKVFQKADSLLNPESAIEFSSALQRLGVTSSELLDPLSAMDMALNDPAKLQDQMTKVAQQFTRLKADGSGFEILPGAKLQLREVAKELGMSADELAGMAIKSSDLDMKLKQIRFPGFAASEEDRMLIANMSQMKDGRAVVQITDEKGSKQEVAVEDLTADQLDKLKQDQANQAKSAEDLARDQLTVQTEIKNAIVGGGLSARLGVASQGPLQRIADANLEVRGAIAKNLYGGIKTKDVREGFAGVSQPAEEALGSLLSGGFSEENLIKVGEKLLEIPNNLTESFNTLRSGTLEGFKSAVVDAVSGVSAKYEGIGGVQKIEKSDVNTTFIDKVISANNELSDKMTNTVREFTVKQTVDFTNSDGSLKAIDSDVLNKAYNHMMFKLPNTPEDLRKLDEGFKSVTSGL